MTYSTDPETWNAPENGFHVFYIINISTDKMAYAADPETCNAPEIGLHGSHIIAKAPFSLQYFFKYFYWTILPSHKSPELTVAI